MTVINWPTKYLRIRFALAIITITAGLMGGTIALFQWIERGDLYYLLGGYARYVLGFGSFAAMIFGSLLLNDSWVAWKISNGKHKSLMHFARQAQIIDFLNQESVEAEHGQESS